MECEVSCPDDHFLCIVTCPSSVSSLSVSVIIVTLLMCARMMIIFTPCNTNPKDHHHALLLAEELCSLESLILFLADSH